MFEDKNFENILNDMLAAAPEGIDTSCGSIFYDAVAPVAMELAKLYAMCASVADDAFPDSASEEALLRHAALVGIDREPATSTILRGRFNVEIPSGAKFSLGEFTFTRGNLEFSATGIYMYEMICDTPGTAAASVGIGTFVPLSYIDGLTSAESISIIKLGRDEEDTESLKKRVSTAVRNVSYGGNRADYINAVSGMDGVGGVKVYSAPNGGGTVKVVVQSVNGDAPESYIIAKIKSELDPELYSGEGAGIAPIGHHVTVEGVSEYAVSVQTKLIYADGWNESTAKSYIVDAVKAYIADTASKWQSSDSLTLRISMLESYILASGCVDDVSNTKIYSETSKTYVAANISLGANVVPVYSEVIFN